MTKIKPDKIVKVLLVLTVLLVGIHVVNAVLEGYFFRFGIVPKDTESLPYVLTAPFIHGNWPHLINNLIGLWVFSTLCMLRGVQFYLKSSFLIIILTGLLVWCFGRSASHIGASGWLFGLWSLAIATAWFDRRFLNIVIAVVVVLFYGGMIVGVLPGEAHVSFESHLFGALAGVAVAYLMSRKKNFS
jgi:membrane associated rhomboid family serine protease